MVRNTISTREPGLANLADDGAAVHLGQADVEDGDVGPQRLNAVERGLRRRWPRRRRGSRLSVSSARAQAVAEEGMIFGNHDADLSHSSRRLLDA